jgi:hypothetical protein
MAWRHVVTCLNGVTIVPSNGVLTQFLFPLQFFRHCVLQGFQPALARRSKKTILAETVSIESPYEKAQF